MRPQQRQIAVPDPGHSLGSAAFDVTNTVMLLLIGAITLYPFLHTIAISISDYNVVAAREVGILPIGLHMQSYRRVFENTLLMRSYLNTIIYSATGTTISLILLVLAAYPLSVNYFRGRKIVAILYIITMYFGGGLIPTYLLIQALGLLGTMWAVVLPPIAGVFHLLLVRSYFQRIPESLRESAFVDGASHLQVLGRIYLPLSLPIIATMSLFIVVGFWNEYFAPLIYIGELRKQPLQVILREILIKAEFGDFMNSSTALRDWEFIPPPGLKRSLQGASIIVSVLPLLFLYPFLQRYFVHGALIGAVKS